MMNCCYVAGIEIGGLSKSSILDFYWAEFSAGAAGLGVCRAPGSESSMSVISCQWVRHLNNKNCWVQ